MLKEIIKTFLDKLKLATNSGGLGIDAILGRPETGREENEFPLCAAIFDRDEEATIPRNPRRIGETPHQGRTIRILLYLFATDEVELMDLIDLLHAIKSTYTGFPLSGKNYAITYEETQRVDPDPDDPTTRFVTVTPVSFTTI